MPPAVKKIRVGAAADFPEGKFTIVAVGAREIGVIRLRGGAFRAVLNRCPHKGAAICKGLVGGTWPPSAPGQMQFEREGEVLICPWHGFEYDLVTGEEMYQDRPTRLRMYPAAVEDGEVIISIPNRT